MKSFWNYTGSGFTSVLHQGIIFSKTSLKTSKTLSTFLSLKFSISFWFHGSHSVPKGRASVPRMCASGSWKLREQPSELSTSPLRDSSDRTLDELNVPRCSSLVYLCLSWFQVLDMTPPEAERNDNITISGSEIGSFGCFWRFGVSPVLEYIMRCFARLVSDPDSVEGIEQNWTKDGKGIFFIQVDHFNHFPITILLQVDQMVLSHCYHCCMSSVALELSFRS